ncbi:hypothetical protein B0H19DRAFT_124770 [Mycena capillaripes]|nr:hypothetical protein B0H19DRAFT_124770 [Mycena capillaripes]
MHVGLSTLGGFRKVTANFKFKCYCVVIFAFVEVNHLKFPTSTLPKREVTLPFTYLGIGSSVSIFNAHRLRLGQDARFLSTTGAGRSGPAWIVCRSGHDEDGVAVEVSLDASGCIGRRRFNYASRRRLKSTVTGTSLLAVNISSSCSHGVGTTEKKQWAQRYSTVRNFVQVVVTDRILTALVLASLTTCSRCKRQFAASLFPAPNHCV